MAMTRAFFQAMAHHVRRRTRCVGVRKEVKTLASRGFANLDPEARVIVVGKPTADGIRTIQKRGARDILACCEDVEVLRTIEKNFEDPGTCGNDLGVRVWEGKLGEIPPYMGSADAVVFQDEFEKESELQQEALARAGFLLKPGGRIVLMNSSNIVESGIPLDAEEIKGMVEFLPLELDGIEEDGFSQFAVLRQPNLFMLPGGPVEMEGSVVTGFGRGSKQMGVPTANLSPDEVGEAASRLPRGVYFGWAVLKGAQGDDGAVHKMVMNIGRRPTFVDGDGITVEVHILHPFREDFYGRRVRVALVSFLRPEVKFRSLQELITRIQTDVGMAKTMLELPELQEFRSVWQHQLS